MVKTYPMAFVTAPKKVEFREKSLPKLFPKDVLIKVKATAICGSDLHIFRGKHPAAPLPVAIGHELSGEVLRIGKRVSKVKEGDRIVVEPVIICGECYFCRRGEYHLCLNISFQYRKGQGGFAPYFVAEENWVHPLPENISFEEGSMVEPLSVAIHAVKKGNLRFGQSIAIFGAGAIGLLVLVLSRLSGAGEVFVVDVQGHRLRKAKELGAFETYDNSKEGAVERIFEETSRLGVDRSFEAVGLEGTLLQSLKVLRKGGVAILVGIFENPEVRIPANIFVQREISLMGSQGYCWDFQTALKMLERGQVKLKGFITHVLPLSSLQEALELLMDPEQGAIKVIIKMDVQEN
ncbi:MAG TPA: alcohol dehydrogenase catalytic domain-containing protein [Thermodesulfobacteriota bacterium]|nr:alcohol dehydrogenase catalytic domain-containing protein [Thermodesulfobacteriota bacterium]